MIMKMNGNDDDGSNNDANRKFLLYTKTTNKYMKSVIELLYPDNDSLDMQWCWLDIKKINLILNAYFGQEIFFCFLILSLDSLSNFVSSTKGREIRIISMLKYTL